MSTIEYSSGEVIFRQGYPGDHAYMVVSGKVEIYLEEADGSEKHIAIIGPDQLFGEMAVMDEAPRNASARAMEYTVLKTVDLY
jgi:CRP/FNR family transcriptional regulator